MTSEAKTNWQVKGLRTKLRWIVLGGVLLVVGAAVSSRLGGSASTEAEADRAGRVSDYLVLRGSYPAAYAILQRLELAYKNPSKYKDVMVWKVNGQPHAFQRVSMLDFATGNFVLTTVDNHKHEKTVSMNVEEVAVVELLTHPQP